MPFSEVFGPNTGKSIAARKESAAMEAASDDMGREGDSMIVRASPFTIKLLQDIGGAGSFNPESGMLEFYGLDDAVKRITGKYGYK
jgi:hypothetical protein